MAKRLKLDGWPLLLLLLMGTRVAIRHVLSLTSLRSLALRAGFPPDTVDTAVAVAMAESGGDEKAMGDPLRGLSYGLWQINSRAHPQYVPMRLLEAEYNARAAFEISKGGRDWSPWTTFRNGDYRRYLGGPS